MSNLKYIYAEIIQGYSVSRGGLYIKHFGLKDEARLHSIYTKYVDKAIAKKLLMEDDLLKQRIEFGLWTKEETLKDKRGKLDSAKQALKSIKNFRDIVFVEKQIDELKIEIENLEKERLEHLSSSVENFARSKTNEAAIYHAIYKDKDLTNNVADEFSDEMYMDDFENYVHEYNDSLKDITSENIKKIAFSNMLLNHIYLADSVMVFYGKPVIELTYFQIDLFSYGMQYKNIVSSNGYPPNDVKDNPDEIIQWAESLSNQPEIEKPKLTPDLAKTLKEKGTINFREFVNGNSGGKNIIM